MSTPARSRFADPPATPRPEPQLATLTAAGPNQARAPRGTPIGGQWIDAIRGVLTDVKDWLLDAGVGDRDEGEPGNVLVEDTEPLPQLAGDHSHIKGSDTDKNGKPYGDDVAEATNAAYDKYVELEPQVTRDITDALAAGGMDPSGLEFRLKEPASLGRKIRDDVPAKGSASAAAAGMFDGVRYTGIAGAGDYATASQATLDALREKGYQTVKVKNFWGAEDNPYRGINMQVLGPKGEQIELQFHTPESVITKFKMHPIFEDWRLMDDKDSPEATAMWDEMWEMSNALTEPPNVKSVV